MSQLDYLWLTYGGYKIGTSASNVPQQNVVLNEVAVTSLIKNATNGGILSLEYKDHPINDNLVQLIGKSVDGQVISFVDIPKEVHVQSFTSKQVNSLDISKGCSYPLGTKVLSIVLTNGKEFLVSLESLGLVLSGAETNTTISEIIDGKIYNHVKTNKATLSVIELKESTYGLYADLNISPDKSGIELIKAENGLKARIPLGKTGNYIKFDRMSLNTFMALPNKDDSTVYFITDKPYIFVGSQKYGVDVTNDIITDLVYDSESMQLTYSLHDGRTKSLLLGPASESNNGILSKTDYIELQRLKQALEGIVNIKEYINTQINGLATSLSYGQTEGNKKPLYLKNNKGDILSTVWLDTEIFLSNSISRKANAEDVVNAKKAGVIIEEGDQILILQLNNGNKHYINLKDLIITQSFKDSKTIKFLDNGDDLSAEINLADNKIIYVTDSGISANIQVVRENNLIKLYGYDLDEKRILGKFISPTKELQSTLFISNITQETLNLYPPNYVNWSDKEQVILGQDYYILFYIDYNNELQIYYISIPKPSVKISNIEGNLLKQDQEGGLYVLFEWIEQN